MSFCCTPEAFAVLVSIVSAIVAIWGHCKLGVLHPVWDAASVFEFYALSREWCFDSRHLVVGESRHAANVLKRGVQNLQGQLPVALLHEALSQMRAQDGDLSGALVEIRQAAQAVAKFDAEASSRFVIEGVKARVPVEEAELLLQTGAYDKAIDVVGTSLGAESNSRRWRVQSLKILISAAIQLNPSAEELAEVGMVFEQTRQSIKEHADVATKVMIHDVAALLSEARKDWDEAEAELSVAIGLCRQAAEVGSSLKRVEDRADGDATQAAHVASLHARMTSVLAQRAARGDVVQAAWHGKRAVELSQKVGGSLSVGEENTKDFDHVDRVDGHAAIDTGGVLGSLEAMKAKLEGHRSAFEEMETSKPVSKSRSRAAEDAGDMKTRSTSMEYTREGSADIKNSVKSDAVVEEEVKKVRVSDSSSPTPSTRSSRRRPRDREAMLIASMQTSENDSTVCMTHCRYGMAHRHPWPECLDRCIENPLVRKTFMDMLPAEHHAAKTLEAEVPVGLQLPSES